MRKLCRTLLTAGLLLTLTAGIVDAQGLEGKKAPAIDAQDWINAEKGTTLGAFEGKIIFLEFTATW